LAKNNHLQEKSIPLEKRQQSIDYEGLTRDCRRRGSNPHTVASTGFWGWRACGASPW